jgi:hypothetical protein
MKALPVEKETWISHHPVWTLLLVTFVVLLVFFSSLIFGGKALLAPDAMSSNALTPFVKDAQARGMTPLWIPYIFSGMPSFGSLMSAPGIDPVDDIWRAVLNLFHLPSFSYILLNYVLFAGLMYLLMRDQKVYPLIAVLCGVAVILMPQFVAFTMYGHNTKFLSLVLIPVILLLVRRLLAEKNLLYFTLAALAIGLQTVRAHIQVTYYTFLAIFIYYLFKEIAEYRETKSFKPALHSALWLAGAVFAGLLLSAKLYISVLDYQRFSIRGGGGAGIEGGGGLDYDYASSWSFHPVETITFFIPSFMGYGGETYWGQMPWTDYPLYFGVVIFMLAGVAFVLQRNRMTWYVGLLVLISLLISFGNHLPLLYGPMFKALPYFNRFRVPSMIHILLDIGMVVLAGIGLQAIFDLRQSIAREQDGRRQLFRYLYIFSAIVGVALLFLIFAKSTYLDLAGSGKTALSEAQRMQAYNKSVLDGFKAILLVGLTVFLISQFLKGSLSRFWLSMILIAMVVSDMWMVSAQIVQPRSSGEKAEFFTATPAVDFIKKDKTPYRIFPVLDDKSGNWYSYHFLSNITGYSPAKLRIYQEFLEETGLNSQDRFGLNGFLSKYWRIVTRNGELTPQPVSLDQIAPSRLQFESAMLDMLNVKYLIVNHLPLPDPRYKMVYTQQPWVYENTTVLPRAFFVDSTVTLRGRRAIFDYMKSGRFAPHRTAILEDSPASAIVGKGGNTATVTATDIHEIRIEATAQQTGLLVLSDIYYPSGWKAYIDGKETKIYKTNYILRSVLVPPGQHSIIFKFDPASYHVGVWISAITLTLLLAGLAFTGWQARQRLFKKNAAEQIIR